MKKRINTIKLICLYLLLLIVCGCSYEKLGPQIEFASSEIQASLALKGEKAKIVFKIEDAEGLKAEGFEILKEKNRITIIGKDAAGAMYGGLDVAESIRSEGLAGVQNKIQNPHLQMRGTKFNIPLDVRSPSYGDMGDSGQKNISEMWSMDFWKEYINTMAKYRYNYISLWSLHPFPSLVKLDNYPDIALDDVKRSTGPFNEYYLLRAIGLDTNEYYNNQETIKKLTIDEKITFWREVMKYGKSRNVDFYFITWNIFTYGVEGKYGITDDPDNETTTDYFRSSAKELILTYPDLAGIGITTGENMYWRKPGMTNMIKTANTYKGMKGMTAEEKEDWMVKTYVEGTLEALEAQPGRKIRFIHRQHEADADMVLGKMHSLINHPDVDFIFSFKYAKAHVYSATKQPYHEKFVSSIHGKVKTIWTLRNDDVYLFRWAAPDFVREFVKNIPNNEVSQGYYYGHDGWVNGREFTQLDHETPRQMEVNKHWLQWMLWGRMAYNPDYSNERIIAILNERYPEVDGATLLNAWQKASMVYPRVTGFHWGVLDYQWYIEGARGHRGYATRMGAKYNTGFHDVNTFLNIPPHKYAKVQSINDYVVDKETDKQTPLSLADLIEKDVNEALHIIKQWDNITNKELRLTIDDIRIICEMGKYYADKIRGATYVALARKSKNKADKHEAIASLSDAAEHYKKYVELVTANHVNEIWLSRVGTMNFTDQIEQVMLDIDNAKEIEVE